MVEELSLPTINFLDEYNTSWNKGVAFWVSSLIENGEINGDIKKAFESSSVDDLIYNKTFYEKVRKRINKNVDK